MTWRLLLLSPYPEEVEQLSKKKKTVYLLLAGVMALTVIIEVLFAHPHYHMLWNTVPGFDLIIGFAGGWALILLAKVVMAKILQRDEAYYETDNCCDSGSAGDCEGSSTSLRKDGEGNV